MSTMISKEEALEIAERFVTEQCRSVTGGCAIMLEQTIDKSYGWIFFYNSKCYLKTGNPLEALGGNGPLVVERADGRVHALGSGQDPDDAIAEFERVHGLM
jgi:hypothetical protein